MEQPGLDRRHATKNGEISKAQHTWFRSAAQDLYVRPSPQAKPETAKLSDRCFSNSTIQSLGKVDQRSQKRFIGKKRIKSAEK